MLHSGHTQEEPNKKVADNFPHFKEVPAQVEMDSAWIAEYVAHWDRLALLFVTAKRLVDKQYGNPRGVTKLIGHLDETWEAFLVK